MIDSIRHSPLEELTSSPLVTAIIPTYNRGYIVCEAVDSILQQVYRNVEIIVVDDGSTDDTKERLRRYGSKVKVLYQSNAGPAAARNAGVREASGSIICFLDSDDVYLPHFIERHVMALEKAGEAIPCSISNALTRFADGRSTSSFEVARLRPAITEGLWVNALDVLLTRFVMCAQMLAVRRRAFQKIGLFDESLIYLEDYDIAYRLSLEGPWAFIQEPSVIFRQSTTGDSLSLSISSDDPKLHSAIVMIRERVRDLVRSGSFPVSSRYLTPAILNARRELLLKTMKRQSYGARRQLLSWCDSVARYGFALFEHSWLYPEMKVVPFRDIPLSRATRHG